MDHYQGEFPISIKETPFHSFGKEDWIKHWIEMYGCIQGSHHREWLIDQIYQIATGSSIIITEARWGKDEVTYKEFRFKLGEPTASYFEGDWEPQDMVTP